MLIVCSGTCLLLQKPTPESSSPPRFEGGSIHCSLPRDSLESSARRTRLSVPPFQKFHLAAEVTSVPVLSLGVPVLACQAAAAQSGYVSMLAEHERVTPGMNRAPL